MPWLKIKTKWNQRGRFLLRANVVDVIRVDKTETIVLFFVFFNPKSGTYVFGSTTTTTKLNGIGR